MSEMVERVAKALEQALLEQAEEWGHWVGELNEDGSELPYDGRMHLETLARAMIAAMREPTEAMDRAAAECESSYVGDVYNAMIDAALGEAASQPSLPRCGACGAIRDEACRKPDLCLSTCTR